MHDVDGAEIEAIVIALAAIGAFCFVFTLEHIQQQGEVITTSLAESGFLFRFTTRTHSSAKCVSDGCQHDKYHKQ